jgi:hypothetical protein
VFLFGPDGLVFCRLPTPGDSLFLEVRIIFSYWIGLCL